MPHGVFRQYHCNVEGCDKPHHGNGLCRLHKKRIKKGKSLDLPYNSKKPSGHTWRGPKGAVFTHAPKDHPNADRNGNILEHRLVISEVLGRGLRPGETVHHKNGVKDDNRPENLELRVGAHPQGLTVEEAVAWAHEILARYEDVREG